MYLGEFAKLALKIYVAILIRNRWLSYDFILGKLPYAPEDIFVDAASSWGIRGLYEEIYFMIPTSDLTRFRRLFEECSNKDLVDIPRKELPIAYLTLLTSIVSVLCFSSLCRGRIVRLNCDNTNCFFNNRWTRNMLQKTTI